MSKEFGITLKELRRSKNISQRELANEIGVDFSYISKVENGKLPPPAADTIVKIAEALGISSEDLLSQTGKLPSDIKAMIGTNSTALKFMNLAKEMNLTNDEWNTLSKNLKKLR